ncbi:MAG: family 10 glycosylhydrolase [Planctomycetota bacterium]
MLAAALCAVSLAAPSPRPVAQEVEIRGVWIPNSHSTFFDSPQNVRDQMEALSAAGVNVVFPVVWSKGYTLFDSAVAEEVVGARKDPRYGDRDPLAEVLFEAHRHGIEVVPWFEYGFAAGHETFPGQALVTHPEWAAIGVDGQPVVKNGFQWMNALDPDVQRFMTDLVLECATIYDIDGVQGDDRLPALPAEAGYDDRTSRAYRREKGRRPPEDIHDPEWTQWRADRLTDYLAKLRRAVKRVSEDHAFSMAPGGPSWSLRDYLQDQKTWVERGLVDALHPQLYVRDVASYQRSLDAMLKIEWLATRRDLIAPGVLASFRDYVASDEMALGAVRANRESGLAGEVWFYELGLLAQDGRLAATLTGDPYAQRARLPWREDPDWRPGEVVAEREPKDEWVSWRVEAPTSGTYTIWVDYAYEPESDGTKPARAREYEPGWHAVGIVKLRAGRPREVLRVAAADAADARKVMVLIDRRADRR